MSVLIADWPKRLRAMRLLQSLKPGGSGLQNGDLLKRAETQFDVLLTVDRNVSFQQHLPKFAIAVVVLQAPTNRLKDLRTLLSKLHRILPSAPNGQVTVVSV